MIKYENSHNQFKEFNFEQFDISWNQNYFEKPTNITHIVHLFKQYDIWYIKSDPQLMHADI